MKGEESAERVVSGDGAGGDILCAGAKFVTKVSNLTLRGSLVRWRQAWLLATNLEIFSLGAPEDSRTGLRGSL
jgi:hypothetical protein